ncbi:class I SAM-dependent methyltransferase [Arenicellales bacterium IMCC56312]
MFDKIEQLRLLQDTDHVFEFGCGVGWNLSKFAIAEKNVVGLEANSTLVELGQEKGLNVQIGSFADLDKIENPVDLLILNHVLEHFHDRVDKLKRLRAMIRADGYIYIGVPSLDNFHFGPF